MAWLPPLDRSYRRGARRALFVLAALFAFNAAVAAADGRWWAALGMALVMFAAVSMRMYTSEARWPAAERWLREVFGREGRQ